MALNKGKSGGFVYKPRTIDQVKERANRKASQYDSIFKQGYDTFTPKQGDNLIRFLPARWDDSNHYGYTVFVHGQVGPDKQQYLCLKKMKGEPCPVCEEHKVLKDAGEADDAREIAVSERIVSWILNRDADDPEKPLIYNQSWTQDRDITALVVNERTGAVLMIDHPDVGYDVSFKRSGTRLKTKYYGWAIDREESPIAPKARTQEEILDYIAENPIPDVLQFYSYDYIKNVLSGTVAKKDKDLDEDDEQPLKGKKRDSSDDDEQEERRGSTRRSREPELNQEDEDDRPRGGRKARDEEEDQDEDEKPRSRSSKRAAPVEEEDEDVDEETGEVTTRKPVRRPKDEEEDEDEKPVSKRASTVRRPKDEDEEEEVAPRRAGRR